jgi:glycosyltransferase involved in cell wall biosynthesis
LPQRLLAAGLAVLREARGADVLYVQGLAGPEMAAVLVGRALGKPVALKIVGDNAWEYAIRKGLTADGIDEFQRASYPLRLRCVRRLVRTYARLATRLIVPSEYLKGIVVGWGLPAERVTVIRNALTVPLSSAAERAADREVVRAALGASGPLVVTCARLYPWKNMDTLIRIVPLLPAGAHLVIVGGGPDHGHLQSLAGQLGLKDRVHITGNVPHAEVQRYLRAADVFVLNTRYEGLSHVLLEAMAAGTPVVASRVGGNAEVVEQGRTGLLVPLNDRDALVRAIVRLLQRPDEGAALAAAAQQRVQEFSWPRLVDATERTLVRLTVAG